MTEISTHDTYEISDLLDLDYPPHIEIAVKRVPPSPDSGPLCLQVTGLNKKSIFKIYPGTLYMYMHVLSV